MTVSLERSASERRAVGTSVASGLSGTLGFLLCAGSALVLPAFSKMFAETGISLPASTEIVVGVPRWAWWVLSGLSIVLMSLKDRLSRRALLYGLNGLYVALVIGAGFWIVSSLFAPCTMTERL